MKVILDTNVLVSGIFFKGPPYRIFQIWKKAQIDIVIRDKHLLDKSGFSGINVLKPSKFLEHYFS